MTSATYGNYTFRLDAQGVVSIDPPLEGNKSNPFVLSIAKWEFIADCLEGGLEVHSDGNYKTCALCQRYTDCDDCPVRVFAGVDNCLHTPMTMWASGLHTLPVAKAEFYFLMALREYYNEREKRKGE